MIDLIFAQIQSLRNPAARMEQDEREASIDIGLDHFGHTVETIPLLDVEIFSIAGRVKQ